MTPADPPAVLAQGLVKHFGDVRAVDGIDLVLPRGQVLGVLGPNGAGKTTTVKMITSLLVPDAGTVEVFGIDVAAHPDEAKLQFGLAGQYAAVDENLTGRENLVMIGRLSRLSGSSANRRATELLERFGLAEAGNRLVGTYSGGMRRRLDLAAALVREPPLMLLDEPTTGLDPRSRQDLWEIVRELVAGGTSVLLTTQYLEEADELADSIVVIDRGKVIAQGTAAELKGHFGSTVVELEVTPAEAATLSLDVESIGALVPDGESGRYHLAVPEPSHGLVTLVRALDRHGITPERIAIREPSLDDVFLELTGKPAEDVGPEASGRGGRE